MQHKVICPRDGCKNEAITDMTFGVLPCAWHQQEDEKTTISNSPRFWNLNKLHRIQREQDQHNGDTLQPWENGGRKAWDLIADGWPRDSREISFCGFQGADLPPWLAECKSVCVLDLYACSNIKSLPQFLGDLVNVHFMDISECSSLTHLPAALSRMVSLTLLRMNGCTSINFLPDLSNLRHRGLKIALDDRLFPWLDAGCAECSGFASV